MRELSCFELKRAVIIGLLTCALLACQRPVPEHIHQPNILLLMADDWNWPHSEGIIDPNIQTPTFDRIAREGVMFQNAFVASPSCTPCRASLLTGRHPWELETGVHLWGALPPESEIYQRVAGKRPGEELYSIKRDPYQLQNLAEDPEFAEIKAQLSKDLDHELRRTGDPRIIGKHEEVFYVPHYENQKKGRQ